MTGMTNFETVKGKALRSVDCGTPSVFSTGELRYFISKGLGEPKRCPQCRLNRKPILMRGGGEL